MTRLTVYHKVGNILSVFRAIDYYVLQPRFGIQLCEDLCEGSEYFGTQYGSEVRKQTAGVKHRT